MSLERLASSCLFPSFPGVEVPDWIRRCALEELLQSDFSILSEAALYRNLDKLHPRREQIETALAAREDPAGARLNAPVKTDRNPTQQAITHG